MNAAEALTLSERRRATPDLSFPLAIEACRACLVSEATDFEAQLEVPFDFMLLKIDGKEFAR